MNLDFLEFEQPIAELRAKIEELRLVGNDNEINIQEEIDTYSQELRWTSNLQGNLNYVAGLPFPPETIGAPRCSRRS